MSNISFCGLYNSNNLFYDNSYIKRSGASHAFRAAIEKDIVTIKGDKLPPSYLVEAFVKNSKGLAVEKIAEGVVDADGNVEIKKNINTLSEELEGISILMSPPSDVKNKGSYGFIDVPFSVYYVKTNGTGHGTSWKDAMSPEDFVEKIQFCLEGTTFYIANGEYTLGNIDVNTSVSIKGGYLGDNSEPLPNVLKYKTTFIGIDPKNNYQGFDFKGTTSEVIIENCYFNHYMISAASHAAGNYRKNEIKSLQINNCNFENFKEISAASTSISISNSSFKNRISSWLSWYYIYTASDDFTMTDCSFVDDATDINSSDYRLMRIDALDAFISNCTFVNSRVSNKGSIFVKNSHLKFYNNTIIESPYEDKTGYVFIVDESKNSNIDVNGNIFISHSNNTLYDKDIRNNILTYSLTPDNDYVVNMNDVSTFLDGTYDAEKEFFIPNLTVSDNKLITTIKIINDEINSTPIRFTRLSDVTKDANGVTRLSNTCPGAVEFEKEQLQLKSAQAKIYGVECRNESGSIEVSWARKSFNSDQTFKLVVMDENGEAYESEIQDQTKGSGLFKISGLTPGTYTYKFYVKKGETFVPTEHFSISIQYQFYTAIGEAPSGNKFIIKC